MQHHDLHDEDIKLYQSYSGISSPQDLADFMRSRIYQDFCGIAELRKQAIKDDLTKARTMDEVNRLQGEYASVDFWEQFPIGLIRAIEEDREERENVR